MDTSETIQWLEERAALYRVLARAYKVEVDREFLDQLRQMTFSSEDVDEPEISQGYRLLDAYLKQVGPGTLTDLAVDYARVFLGAGIPEALAAYPYESVYTSPDRLIMQDARDEVLKEYRSEGLDKSDDWEVPEDHIGLELDFMAHLCQKTAEALAADDLTLASECVAKQRRFLEGHLLRWVPAFCADVQKHASTDFYRAVALITDGYLQTEKTAIADLAGAILA